MNPRLRAPVLITGVFLAILVSVQFISAAPVHSNRGAWAVGVVYAAGDTVSYRNSIYLCIKAHV